MEPLQAVGEQNYWPGSLPLKGVTSLWLKKQMMKIVLEDKMAVYKRSLIN